MGVLFDYFAAGTDPEAAAVIDRVGGPRSQQGLATRTAAPKRGGLFRHKSSGPASVAAPALAVYETITGNGTDPVVQLGTLEELLTGRPYEEIVEDPRSGHVLASRDGGERVVCTLTDSLVRALAGADDAKLQSLALPWSQTDEFWDAADPSDLAEFLGDLAGLARHAQDNGQNVYCWMCV